jgi:hypothetical protein
MYDLTAVIGLQFEHLKTPADICAVAAKSRDIEARGRPIERILDHIRILSDG